MLTTLKTCVCGALLLAGFAGASHAAEQKVRKSDLPPAVQKAADDLARDSRVVGYSKEVENGKTLYEIETTSNGMTKDVTFDAQGNNVSVEQQVKLESLPPAVQNGLKKGAGKGKITKVETVTKGGVITYEAAVTGGPVKEIIVDSNGVPVKE